MRLSDRDDFEEDLYLTIRELVEVFKVPPSSIRRMVNRGIKEEPWSASLRSRVLLTPSGSTDCGPESEAG